MRFTGLVLVLLLCPQFVFSQEWKGLEPLSSSCEDVRRVLGVDKCEYPLSTYRLEDETVTINFVTCPCELTCYHESVGWNVPLGTVGSIIRQLRKPISIVEFNVDQSWKHFETDMIGHVIYNNPAKGIKLSVINGKVDQVTYYPQFDKYRHLLCPRCSLPGASSPQTDTDLSIWARAFGDLTLDKQREPLDDFAAKLKERSKTKGYIVAYGGCRDEKAEIVRKLEQAKNYVIRTHGINARRVMTIYGGQRQDQHTELHIRLPGVSPPQTFSSTYAKVPN